MAKIGHHAWAIAHAKWSVWVKNEKCQKGVKNDHTTTLELVWAKSAPKKQLLLEKLKNFKNGEKWPPCMGYSPCKVVSLGQKLKMLKNCEKLSYDHIKFNMSKKVLQKTPNTGKMRRF